MFFHTEAQRHRGGLKRILQAGGKRERRLDIGVKTKRRVRVEPKRPGVGKVVERAKAGGRTDLARGVMVEEMPDAKDTGVLSVDLLGKSRSGALAVASRNILGKLGLKSAELRKTTPLSFACRCSPDRAIAMLAALSPEERAALPPTIDITCHMCGRTFTVNTRQTS